MVDSFLFADGASRGNPGLASLGVVSFSNETKALQRPAILGEPLFQYGKYLGNKTNNEAEYHALVESLRLCIQHKKFKCSIFMDSQLVIRQMQGRYKIRSPQLRELFIQAKKFEEKMEYVDYTHIPRKENYIADQLANDVLDAYIRKGGN